MPDKRVNVLVYSGEMSSDDLPIFLSHTRLRQWLHDRVGQTLPLVSPPSSWSALCSHPNDR